MNIMLFVEAYLAMNPTTYGSRGLRNRSITRQRQRHDGSNNKVVDENLSSSSSSFLFPPTPSSSSSSLSTTPSTSSKATQSEARHHHHHHQPIIPSTSSSSFSSTSTSSTHSLNVIESWCTTHLLQYYQRSLNIKCPFLRRRSTDMLDSIESIMRFLIIRHKSLPLIGPPLAWTATTTTCSSVATAQQREESKMTHLPPEMLMDMIRNDWKVDTTHKGYYVTGKLTKQIYRNDCYFDGPDPDMPVRGLHKYLNAASQLFETQSSTATLLKISIQKTTSENDNEDNNQNDTTGLKSKGSNNEMSVAASPRVTSENDVIETTRISSSLATETMNGIWTKFLKKFGQNDGTDMANFVIVAEWELQGVLHLPWHPKLPTWTGRTTYYFDSQHLVTRHVEEWDISVFQAFAQTLLPAQIGNQIWSTDQL